MVPLPSDTAIPHATQPELVLHLHSSAPGKLVTASRVAEVDQAESGEHRSSSIRPAVQDHMCAHGDRVLQVIHTLPPGKALPLLGNSGLR